MLPRERLPPPPPLDWAGRVKQSTRHEANILQETMSCISHRLEWLDLTDWLGEGRADSDGWGEAYVRMCEHTRTHGGSISDK